MKINVNAVAITSAISGAFGIGYGIATHLSQKKLATKLNTSLEDLTKNTTIDIPQELINDAVSRKVDMKVAGALDSAATRAVNAVRDDIHATVRTAVAAEMDKKQDLVEEKLDAAISNMDMEALKTKVFREAREKLVNSFEDDLNDILEAAQSRADNQLDRAVSRFNGKLDNEFDQAKRRARNTY